MILSDVAAERAVLAGVCRYGSDAYYDVGDLVDAESFTIESNCMIYSCLKHIMEKDSSTGIDLPTILSSAKEIGLDELLANKEEVNQFIVSVFDGDVKSSVDCVKTTIKFFWSS